MPLSSGTRFGPFEILSPLGAGGMGEVYRAQDTRLKRQVALKVLPEVYTGDRERMIRFQREAELLAALNHPNIAAIYGLEENALIMELVEGETLPVPLPMDTALLYARQIAEALEYAHERNVIHRDLKPANIKVTADGIVKLLDFGLAKAIENPAAPTDDPANSPTLTLGVTKVGVILGTAAYMSPEQASGKAADRRADIWSFGAVLYEMLSGSRAFEGVSVADTLANVLKVDPDWSKLPAATPASIRRLIRRCLMKDRKQRLQAIGDVRIVLQEAIGGTSPEDVAAPATGSPRNRLPWMAAAGVLAIIAAGGWWVAWRRPALTASRPFLQLDLDAAPNQVWAPAISPDGTRIAFASQSGLAVRRLDQVKAFPLAGTEGAQDPFFSPNGQWVAFFAGSKLLKVALEGGTPITLCDASNSAGGTWLDDDNIVASVAGGLVRVAATGGLPQPLTDPNSDHSARLMHRWPQALPGGKGILLAATNGSFQGSLQVLTLNDGKLKTIVEKSTHGRFFAGGYLVYFQRGGLLAAPMDLSRLELTGAASPLVNGVANSGDRADFELSNADTLVYRAGTSGTTFTVSWLYPSGKTEPVLAKPGNYVTPRLSPDGTRMALAVTVEGRQNIWIYDLRRETFTRLTFDAGPDLLPTWTPDGEFVAFRSGNALSWTRSDGSGKVQTLAGVSRNAGPWSFSADGQWLAFWPLQPGSDLWIVPVTRTPGEMHLGQPQLLLEQKGSKGAPAISPDGRWVAYTSEESGRFEIYVMSFSPQGAVRSRKWQVSSVGGVAPIWSRASGELFYDGFDRRVWVAAYTVRGDEFVAEKPRVWSETRMGNTGFLPRLDVSSDGKRALALFGADDPQGQTLLRVMLNVDSELRRRARGK